MKMRGGCPECSEYKDALENVSDEEIDAYLLGKRQGETPPMVPEGEAVKCHALQGGYAVPGQFKIGRNERGFKMKQKEHAALIFQDDPDALLLTPVAAEFLGISPKYLRKLRTTGGGPEYVRISQDAPIKTAT